jgi:hypothetical protein
MLAIASSQKDSELIIFHKKSAEFHTNFTVILSRGDEPLQFLIELDTGLLEKPLGFLNL